MPKSRRLSCRFPALQAPLGGSPAKGYEPFRIPSVRHRRTQGTRATDLHVLPHPWSRNLTPAGAHPGKIPVPRRHGRRGRHICPTSGGFACHGRTNPGRRRLPSLFRHAGTGLRPASPSPDGLRRTGAAKGRKKAHIGTCCREYIGEQEVRK